MYLSAPPLIRKALHTEKHSLALDPTVNTAGTKSLPTPELFVGNIPFGTKWYELKNWFIGLGFNVSRVELKQNIVRISSYF